MKRIYVLLLLVVCFVFLTGCTLYKKKDVSKKEDETSDEAISKEYTVSETDSDDYEKYKGIWKLKVSEDEMLYRMTALEIYFGATGISIDEINNDLFKGSIYSVQGAPSYRQANVSLEGEVKEDQLMATYEDDAWLYSGNIEITLKDDLIKANINRDPVETPPMWGIPEGKFDFVRAIETEIVDMPDDEKAALEEFLFPVSKQCIQPFNQDELTDEMIINFIGVNLGLGYLYSSEISNGITEEDGQVVFDESIMNTLANKYFGIEIKEHQSGEIITYEDGIYKVPSMGGVSEYPIIQVMLKDSKNKDVYYAIVDYVFDSPEEATKLEYQYLIKLEKEDNYIIKEITEIKSPIDFVIFNQLLN